MDWAWTRKVPKWVWIVGGVLAVTGAVHLLFPEEMARIRRENQERAAAQQEAREQKKAEKEAKRAADKAEREQREQQAEAEHRATVTRPGQYGWLGTPSGVNPILVAATKDDLDRYTKIAMAHDQLGGNQMLAAGSLFPVTPGTRVLVTDHTFTATEIRVQDGPYTGRSAWVPFEYVRSSPPSGP